MSDGERPRVCILTVTYNSAPFIGAFAASLAAIEYPNWDLLAIDNASTDDTVALLRKTCPKARIHCSKRNLGFAAGNNVGILHCIEAGYDFVLFLNNDTVVTPRFLSTLVDAADDRTIVVPKILYYDDPRLVSTHAGDFDWNRGIFRRTFHARPDSKRNARRYVRTASFCCALVPVKAFGEVGLLDERFFLYYEETDWLERASRQGYSVLHEPDAIIYHRESASSGGGWMTPLKLYYATRNRPYLVRKHVSTPAYLRFFAYFLLTRWALIVKHAVRREPRLARAIGLGVLHAAQGRLGRTLELRDL
jgi:GT2 family glycosyltransferase